MLKVAISFLIACLFGLLWLFARAMLGRREIKKHGCITEHRYILIRADVETAEYLLRSAEAMCAFDGGKIDFVIEKDSPDRDEIYYIVKSFSEKSTGVGINIIWD